ncbi:MAG: hypothetical protein R2834_14600 [Rhodothermales bacterium]
MSSNINLVAPVNESAAEAGATTFEWSAPSLSDALRLQVARDSSFSDVVFDARIPRTTVFTLFNTLRPSESAYFWRVQSGRAGQEAWSETGRFIAVSDEAMAAPARPAAQASAAPASRPVSAPSHAAPRPPSMRRAAGDEVVSPYLIESTPSGMSTAVLVVAVVMMIAIGILATMGNVWP